MRAGLALAAVLLLTPALAQQPVREEAPAGLRPGGFFTLAGGDVAGNYYAVARALCRAVNRDSPGVLRCSPEATPGSVYNLTAVGSGAADFGIVQSDWLVAARDGTGPFARSGAIPDLRGVAVLYAETVTILVGAGFAGGGLADLAATRIDVGAPGSGRRATVERILAAAGLPLSDFAAATELPPAAAVDELCAGRIDVVALVSGHPDANVARAVADCGARLVPIADAATRRRIEGLELYAPAEIAAGVYPGQAVPVPTFAVTADIVARADAPASEVLALVQALTRHATPLQRSAPVLAGRADLPDPTGAWPEEASIPAHPALGGPP